MIQQESDYYPFGGERLITNTVDNRYKFTGLERDSESSLDHTLFRMHASNLGRWLAPDPVAGETSNPGSLNRYTYVLNNAVNFIDSLGLIWGPPCEPCGWDVPTPGAAPDRVPGTADSGLGEGRGATGTRGGGGGGDPKPKQDPQQVVNVAVQDLVLQLLNDPECLGWLMSKVRDPIVEMTLARFSPSGDLPSHFDARVTPEGNVLINSTGSFFFPPQGPPGPFQKNWAGQLFPGATSQARLFILLHESAHLTKVIVPEGGSWVQTEVNNLEVVKHCQKTLGIK